MGRNAVIFATAAAPDQILWLDEKASTESGISYEKIPVRAGNKEPSKSVDSAYNQFDRQFCEEQSDSYARIQNTSPKRISETLTIEGGSISCVTKRVSLSFSLNFNFHKDFLNEQQVSINKAVCESGNFAAYKNDWQFTRSFTFRDGNKVTLIASCK